MMTLTSFGNGTPSLPLVLPSDVIELMLISLAIAALAVAASGLGRFWRRATTVERGSKAGRIFTPARHALPA